MRKDSSSMRGSKIDVSREYHATHEEVRSWRVLFGRRTLVPTTHIPQLTFKPPHHALSYPTSYYRRGSFSAEPRPIITPGALLEPDICKANHTPPNLRIPATLN
jgi:hypothetical protein